MMAAHLRGEFAKDSSTNPSSASATGFSSLKSSLGSTTANGTNNIPAQEEEKKEEVKLENKAHESRSPYVRAHAGNPVKWQLWGDEAIELARKENRLLFVSIGYSACHCEFLLPLDCLGLEENGESACSRKWEVR